jgi:hypothetical protein
MTDLNIVGLDTVGLIIMVVAIAVMMTYILWIGWKFQFTKRQFGFLFVFMILFGMFVMAWLRETGDEILLAFTLFGLVFVIFLTKVLRRRHSRGATTTWR